MRRTIVALLMTLFLGLGLAMVTTVAAPQGATTVLTIDVPRPEPPPTPSAAILAVAITLMLLAFSLRTSAHRRRLAGPASRRHQEVVAPLAPPNRASALRRTAVPSFPVT